MTTQILALQSDMHFRLPLPGRWRVSCVRGSLWITQSGDPHDHVLQAGESRIFTGAAGLLVGTLQQGCLQLEWLGPPADFSGWRTRASLFLQRAVHRYRHRHHRESGNVQSAVSGVSCRVRD